MTTVLVVEDNKMNRDLVNTILLRHEYTTLLAETGEQGVRLFREGDVDIVLMDLQLPGIDGYECYRQIQSLMDRRVPVIAVTGNATSADEMQVKAAGFDAFLTKPFRVREFLALIRLHLG